MINDILEQTSDLFTIAEHLGILVQLDEETTELQYCSPSENISYHLQDEGLDPDNRYIDHERTFLGDKDKEPFSPADRAIASLGPSYVGETRGIVSYF